MLLIVYKATRLHTMRSPSRRYRMIADDKSVELTSNILAGKVRYRSRTTGDEVLALQWVVLGDNRAEVAMFLRRSYTPTPSMEFFMSEGESISIHPGDWVVCSPDFKIGSPYWVFSELAFHRVYEKIESEVRDVTAQPVVLIDTGDL